jgi:hypothetical protein
MKAVTILVTALGLAVGVCAAAGQQTRLLRDQLVGTWSFVIAEITAADGKKSLPFGDKPKGMLIFTADCHFSQVHVAGGLPKIASNNRLAGTAVTMCAPSSARPAIIRKARWCIWRRCSVADHETTSRASRRPCVPCG